MKNSENLGVKELSQKEIECIDGGFWPIFRALVVAAAALHEVTCDGPDDITWHAGVSTHVMDRGAW